MFDATATTRHGVSEINARLSNSANGINCSRTVPRPLLQFVFQLIGDESLDATKSFDHDVLVVLHGAFYVTNEFG